MKVSIAYFNWLEKVEIENLQNPKTFIDYSKTTDDVYENLEDSNPTKKRRVLIVFDDMMADMESNKKLSILCILEEENAIFYLFLCHDLISKYLKL